MRGNADPKGYYRVLGLSPAATSDEIRAAFRERAKQFHPDQSDGKADQDLFRRIHEAYGVLRDARLRLHYDAQGASDTDQSDDRAEDGRPTRLVAGLRLLAAKAWALLAHPWAGRIGGGLLVVLLLVLAVVSATLWSTSRQLDELVHARIAVDDRLDKVLAGEADLRARYRMANFVRLEQALARSQSALPNSSFVYNREVELADSKGVLDDRIRSVLDRTVVELASTIIKIPADRDWLILIEGHAASAASTEGATSQAWQQMLVHVADVIDYLVWQGLPAERLAMRFQAGFAAGHSRPSETAETVEIKLLCCFR